MEEESNMFNKLMLAWGLTMALIAGVFGYHWTVNRVYVPEGQSLMLRYKGPLVFGRRARRKPDIGPRKARSACWKSSAAPAVTFIVRSGGSGPWWTTS